ncbi:MAG: right-handed parallel beta-helix repeat-containing protein [Planctomycetota bacterium]
MLDVEDLIFDGDGYLIYQGFRHKGSGSFTNCGFTDMIFPPYSGLGIAAFGDGPVHISGCTFDQIGRVGVLYFGSGISGSVYSGNVYTGKGDGDFLDYGVELGAGAVATISNSTMTDCRGVASSDGSTSAGMLATTFFGAGTAGTVTSSTFTANSTGIFVGYDGSDTTALVANFNSITGNTSSGLVSTAPLVDAEDNWWGDGSGPEDLAGTFEADNPPCFDPDPSTLLDVINADGLGNDVSDGNVDYCPWLDSPAAVSLVSASACYGAGVGDTVTVAVRMSDLKDYVVGGQFFLEYDSTVLDFVSAVPGDPPFTEEVYEAVVESSPIGTIDYAVGAPGGDSGTPLPTDMAVLTFTALAETCATADLITFRAHDPPTRLTNEFGDHIGVLAGDLGSITIDGTPPAITPPSNVEVNADAGGCDADVTVPALVASDACSGIDTIINDWNGTSDASDTYPSGTTTVTWTVTDNCGNFSTDTQDIIVNAVNDMVVDVELAGSMAVGPITRCITFELFAAGCGSSVTVNETISFTSGFAAGVVVEVPCGNYTCITARDTLHTLRRTDIADFADTGTQYVADFTLAGGTSDNSLIGGNLNGDMWIDILDFGIFVGQWGSTPSPSTPCGTVGPHADINGNAVVGSGDFTFIQINFLLGDETDCCTPMSARRWARPTPQSFDGPITRISVRELRLRGLHDLIVADLNHDGWLDVHDMEAFAGGARP